MEFDIAENLAPDADPYIDGHPGDFSAARDLKKHVSTKSAKLARVNLPESEDSHQQARWTRLSRYYNDKYLSFFIKDRDPEEVSFALNNSQYGSVTWTGTEKHALFCALSARGRHDIPNLAAAVPTKSVVEIRDYLHRLKTAVAEHHMFAPHVKNASLAEIDAAVEINGSLEDKLEKAADSLAAFQDNYDLAKVRNDREVWLIDTKTAGTIDRENEAQEMTQLDQSMQMTNSGSENDEVLHFFRFGTMLQVSKSLFMNLADSSEHDDWTVYAEDNEEPSLTVDAAQEFYNLVKSLTQRVLQTAIFLAQSRIQSATRSDYTPTEALKDIDVVAALNVLDLPVDSWDHWTKFARRSGLNVVIGDHKRRRNDPLSLEQVESTLSIRSSRGRRRSLSSIFSQSSQEEQSNPEDEVELKDTENDVHESVEQTIFQEMSSAGDEDDNESNHAAVSISDSDTGMEDEVDVEVDDTAEAAEPHLSRKRRQIMMEDSQDEYLERLDQMAQLREEHLLQNLFSPDTIKEEPEEDSLRRPRGQRKTKEDLKDWTDVVYYSPWELERLLNESFDASSADRS